MTVFDRTREITCRLDEGHRFHSASVVKATILAALLRWHQETGRPLTSTEKYLATLMITQSDNDAASALWDELGHARIQHFLNLARMTETVLGPGGYWGLTEITARDELSQLRLLTKGNAVLSDASRGYELGLMARVIASQRWGVTAGAPRELAVHVKNGWLPEEVGGWHINSIGAFSGHGRDYMIAVLTDGNPTMDYGVATIQAVARVVHRDVNAGLPAAGAPLPAVSVVPGELPADSAGA
jgi:beta-lactamase class A